MYTSTVTGALLAGTLLLSSLVEAVPAPSAYRTGAAVKAAVTSTSLQAGSSPTPKPSQTPTPTRSTRTRTVTRKHPISSSGGDAGGTGTQADGPYIYTFTDTEYGFVIGCKHTTYVSVSASGISSGIWCDGGEETTFTTDLAIAQTTNFFNDPAITTAFSWTHVSNAYTGPSDGCSFVTTLDTAVASTTMTYCTCGNGKMGGIALGVSGTTSTTICEAANNPALPTGYTQVPFGPGAPDWATPVSTGPCATPTSLSASCWNDLDLAGYASWWYEQNNETCAEGTGFADCWYGQMTPYAPSNCSTLTGDSDVCKQPQWVDFKGAWNAARNFYLTQAIANVNGFLTQYYTAIGDANGLASDQLPSIIAKIDPAKQTNVGLNAAMAALGAGLALVPGLGEGYALANGVMAAVQQVPGLARYAFPQGTVDSQFLDWSDISSQMGTVVGWLQSNVSEATTQIQQNVTVFNIAAGAASFTGPLPALNDLKNQIVKGLYAYGISQAYNKTNKILTRALDTDINAMSTNGTNLAWTPCGAGYNANGTCGGENTYSFWFDKDTTISYAMIDTGDFTNSFDSQMADFLNLVDGKTLFAGSDACWTQHGGSGPIISFENGQTQIPCLASIKTCTWTQTPSTSYGDSGNLFDDCDRGDTLGGYGRGSCNSQDPNNLGADPYGGVILPWGYAGWAMMQDYEGHWEFCPPYQDGEF